MKTESRNIIQSYIARIKPEEIILLSFAATIVLGTILLWLPLSHFGNIGFLDALFTATSAVCVTGLIVVDTGSAFTVFGQCIILLLIEIGGLGVMTFAALAFDLLGRRLSLSGQEAMTRDLVYEEISHSFLAYFRRMVQLVLAIEAAGAAALFVGLLQVHSIGYAAFSAVFHSVSAFCNAGFSLYPDSLIGVKDNFLAIHTVAALIIIGGIGYPVLFDLVNIIRTYRVEKKPIWNRLSVHSRIVLLMSFLLLTAGTVLLMLTNLSQGNLDLSTAFFQSVTARTAGFNTVDMNRLTLAALLVIMILMFIGGSPGSAAGGVKTTTVALWIKQLWSRLKGKNQVVLQDRYIPEPLVRRASTIISISILWNIAGVFILSITENGGSNIMLQDLIFEQISAFATVGLSTGITDKLSPLGKLWIIASMYVGRTGPLTSVLLLSLRKKPADIKFPEAKVMIG
ncbi:MAG: TrkH family potassium uptake protein [Chitinispirillaceae bacterium]